MISPSLDPMGTSLVHQASPLSKLSWFLATTLAATLSDSIFGETVLGLECVILYVVLVRRKTTPAPPVLRVVAMLSVLMFGLNIFLAESPLGQWGTGMRVMDAGIKALRLVSTAVAFFVLTLGTAPRDLARDLERLRFPLWFTETLAITLRFLPVFEINALMFKRAVAIRFAGHDGRDFVLRIPRYAKDAMVGILIMALSQANATAQSLSLRRFSAASARLHYSCASKPLASWLLYSLGVLNLTLVMILFTR